VYTLLWGVAQTAGSEESGWSVLLQEASSIERSRLLGSGHRSQRSAVLLGRRRGVGPRETTLPDNA